MAGETTYGKPGRPLRRCGRDPRALIIHRRGAPDVALIAADELESLIETAHLLRSPNNAKRLITALRRARGRQPKPQAIDKLRGARLSGSLKWSFPGGRFSRWTGVEES